MATSRSAVPESGSLVRALGVWDLAWLYLAAVANLNIVPVVAATGIASMWLWLIAVVFFFVPQGIAVIELSQRMPGEGGLYLWTKESFGDFHGFLCGWCYWTTNMFFVPALLFYLTGISVYVGGKSATALVNSRIFFFALTLLLLWIAIGANIRGLGVGKWVNNIGGAGALAMAVTLMALGVLVVRTRGFGSGFDSNAAGGLPLATFGIVCLGLVGLELGPVMGDETRDPRRTIPRSVLLGGALCAFVYVGSTMALLVGVPHSEMTVVEGMLQAIDKMTITLGMHWILSPLAILMAVAIAGSTSAWVGGSARILLVCGLDRYLPKALGGIHPKYGSPHVALVLFGVLSSAIVTMSFIGASVKEAYVTLLDLAVALQMISYMYLFLSLVRAAFSKLTPPRFFGRTTLRLAAASGLATTLLGLAMAFMPSSQIESAWVFELKMFLTCGFFIGLASGLFFYYSRIKRTSS